MSILRPKLSWLLRQKGLVTPACRQITTYPTDVQEEITVTDDGKVVVCWHPEKSFPYECSKPLPQEKVSKSIFKIEDKDQLYKSFKSKKIEFVREDLMKITFTTKHRWFPISRIKKCRKTPANRPYL